MEYGRNFVSFVSDRKELYLSVLLPGTQSENCNSLQLNQRQMSLYRSGPDW
jgi:hypothetical protein